MTGSTRDVNNDGMAASTEVSVVIPAAPDHLPVPRRIAAALAATLDFDIDAVADLRLAVDEMVSTAIQRARPGSRVTTVFRADQGSVMVECTVAAHGDDDIDRESFGWMVLSTLAEDLAVTMDGVIGDPRLLLSMTVRAARGAQ